MYQSQLDTERQGVLRNMWLTSARLSTAAALTISLNMIIKVRSENSYICECPNVCRCGWTRQQTTTYSSF